MARPTSGVVKTGPSDFSELGQYFCGRKIIRRSIQDTDVTKFRRLGSSSAGASSGALLPDRVINAWVVGASVDDVFVLSTLERVVRSMDSATNALPPEVVKTC
jgi:hypothetical protein